MVGGGGRGVQRENKINKLIYSERQPEQVFLHTSYFKTVVSSIYLELS
jgi:hypothetical protein